MVTVVVGQVKQPSVIPKEKTVSSSSVVPGWKHGPDADTALQPTPIKEEEPVYQTINKELTSTKARVLLRRDIPPQEKMQMVKQITAQQQQIKQYESQGFIPERIKVSGELKPGEMGPPAPVDAYQFKAPEDIQLRWARYQVDQASELPPGLKEVAQFGQGIVSSSLSVIAPVADIFGKRKEFDIASSIAMAKGMTINPFDARKFTKQVSGSIKAGEYGVHYPSALDVAMEPAGWSPKGSTEFLKQHPIFAAGSVAGEIPQWIVGGEVIKATGKVAKAGMRFVVPRATSAFGKVAPVVERTVGKAIPSFAQRIGETTVGKNVRLFAKGYEPVVKGVEKIVGSQSSRVVEGATTVTKITREFKVVPQKWFGFAEREFVPKGTARTVLRPSKEITMIMRPAEKESSILFESTGYKSGLKGTFRSYQSVDVISRYGKVYVDSGLMPTKGSLYNVQRGIKPLTEGELALWHPKVKWLYETVIPSQKGLGIPSIATKTIKKGTEASASLLRQPATITKLVSTGGKTMINVPTGILTNLPISSIEQKIGQIWLYGSSKIASHEMKQYDSMQPVVIPVQKHETAFRTVPVSSRVPDAARGTIQSPIQIQKPRQIKTPDIVLAPPASEYRYDEPFKTPPKGKTSVPSTPVPFIFPGFDSIDSKSSGGYRTSKKKKGKRTLWELPIPELKNLFGG